MKHFRKLCDWLGDKLISSFNPSSSEIQLKYAKRLLGFFFIFLAIIAIYQFATLSLYTKLSTLIALPFCALIAWQLEKRRRRHTETKHDVNKEGL